jgi:hypothetical protein
MSEMEPPIDDEDRAQATLGNQSAFMSMLNMGMELSKVVEPG